MAHGLDAGGGLLVRFPPQVVVDGDVTAAVNARDYGYYSVLDEPQIDYSARQILYVDDGFKASIVVTQESEDEEQQELVITIDGLRNPYNNEASSSFEVVTFNKEDNVLYFVDQIVDGLTVDSQCDYPCNECLSTDRTHCLSCYPNSPVPFLQDTTCLKECSEGRYFDEAQNKCLVCDETCLTCEGSKDRCTSCGVGEFLHLRGTECVKTCGPGFIDDPSNNMCQPCKEGCTACSVSTTNCTACDMAGSTPFYFDFECREDCPLEISVKSDDDCLPCATQCKTCAGDPKTCTSCESYMRFDSRNSDCLDACKPDE